MRYKTVFRKTPICSFLLCMLLGLAGCSSELALTPEPATTEVLTEEENAVERSSETTQQDRKQTEETSEEADKKKVSYYAYYTLNGEERIVYREILGALRERAESITVSTMIPDTLKKVFTCVMNDHPELFYVDGYQYTKYTVGDTVTSISFFGTYSMTEEEEKENRKAINDYVKACLAGMPSTKDEYTKVKYLYDYIIEKTEYDQDAPNNQNICSVFVDKRSVCQGYAKALQYLMQKAGMVSTVVTGYTGQEGHAWNLVRVNGAYYYVDATWGDASYTFEEETASHAGEVPPINYDYFLVTTEDLYITHIPDNTMKLPECVAYKDNYYVREGLYLKEYSKDKLKTIFEQAYAKKSGYVMFRCSDDKVFETVRKKLIDDQEVFGYLKDKGTTIAYTDNRKQRTISFWL